MINFDSKVNTLTLAYIAKLSFAIRFINISTQKINGLALKTYKMVIIAFYIQNNFGKKKRFFRKIFLLADTSMEMVLKMLFLSLNNIYIDFKVKKLT